MIRDEGGRVAVFVPRPGGPLDQRDRRGIARGSGIVGTQLFGPQDLVIDYEGNTSNASNILSYADRVYHAASRHLDKYPTVARMQVNRTDLIEVGEFDGDAVYVYPDRFPDLAEWLDVPEKETFDPHELHRSGPGQDR